MSDNSGNKGEEQSFTIQPHPATTNDPHNDPALGTSGADQAFAAAKGPGPAIVNVNSLEEPKSKEELAARSAELNKD